MERHGCKWFILLLCLSSALAIPAPSDKSTVSDEPTTSDKSKPSVKSASDDIVDNCEAECAEEDCMEQIESCLEQISLVQTEIEDLLFDSSRDIKELDREIKTRTRQIFGSSKDMIKKMREKGEATLGKEKKDQKIKIEKFIDEIKKTTSEITYEPGIFDQEKMSNFFDLMRKVEDEIDRLSQASSDGTTGSGADVVVENENENENGNCDKCTPRCLEDILKEVEKEFDEMRNGEDLFDAQRKVVADFETKITILEDKKLEVVVTDTITKKCYEGHIENLKDLYERSEKIYSEMRDKNLEERRKLTFDEYRELKNLARDVKNLMFKKPTNPACVLGKLEKTIMEMKEFETRLEGENAENPIINSKIGDELFRSIEEIAQAKRDDAEGGCEETWGDFFEEKLWTQTFGVATASSSGFKRKYQISQTNLEKAIAKHIKLLQNLKSEEEKKTSSGDVTDVKTDDEDANECAQTERNQLDTYEVSLVTLKTELGKFANQEDAVQDLKGIIHDLESREISLRRNGGDQCPEEIIHNNVFRADLDKCKDELENPSKTADFTDLKTCIEKVEDKIDGRRKDLLGIQIKKFGK